MVFLYFIFLKKNNNNYWICQFIIGHIFHTFSSQLFCYNAMLTWYCRIISGIFFLLLLTRVDLRPKVELSFRIWETKLKNKIILEVKF
jgi:hypothetical protein